MIWLQIVLRHILSASHLPFLSLIPRSNLMCGTILFAYLGSEERSFFLTLPRHKIGVDGGERGNQTPELYLATSTSWVTSFHSALDFFLLLLYFYLVHRNSSFPPTMAEFVLDKTTYLSNLYYFFLCTIHLTQTCFVKMWWMTGWKLG